MAKSFSDSSFRYEKNDEEWIGRVRHIIVVTWPKAESSPSVLTFTSTVRFVQWKAKWTLRIHYKAPQQPVLLFWIDKSILTVRKTHRHLCSWFSVGPNTKNCVQFLPPACFLSVLEKKCFFCLTRFSVTPFFFFLKKLNKTDENFFCISVLLFFL